MKRRSAQQTVTWRDWDVTVHFAEVDGQAECVGIDLHARAWKARVDSEVIRALPVGAIIREAADASNDLHRWFASDRTASQPAAPETHSRRRGQLPYWTHDRLKQVAVVYLEEQQLPGRRRPTHHVARRFGVSASMAAKVVRMCREEGLLTPTSRGVPSRPVLPRQV